MFEYVTRGTCSTRIRFELEDDKVRSIAFEGGCNGNLKGISRLVEGMDAEKVIETFKGIKCGSKPTSCPDQLALAVEAALKQG
ncbi:MAG: TIGR03905 family TSCPD domain-containing protein [Spirochaetaceae bacterium]|jgi:uncharacterized protein (TIGR03905 family)|nr:TIGR03905 family TSCPD domain-containing protein [Spirochaetaceae bacterium]